MQNLNQFKQGQVVGTLDLSTNANPNAMTCRFRYDDASADTLVPGEGVQLADLGANDFQGPPVVDERTDNTADPIFGIKIYTTKKNSNAVGDIVQVALPGAVVNMNSGAAIARGAIVELVLATPGNIITKAANIKVGIALDKATAADQPVRVLIEK